MGHVVIRVIGTGRDRDPKGPPEKSKWFYDRSLNTEGNLTYFNKATTRLLLHSLIKDRALFYRALSLHHNSFVHNRKKMSSSYCSLCCSSGGAASGNNITVNGTTGNDDDPCRLAFRDGPGTCCGFLGEKPYCCPSTNNILGNHICIADTTSAGDNIYKCRPAPSASAEAVNYTANDMINAGLYVPPGNLGIGGIIAIVILLCACCGCGFVFLRRRRQQQQVGGAGAASQMTVQQPNPLHGQPPSSGYGHSYPDKVYYDSGPGAGYYGPGYGPQSFYHQSGRPYQQQQPGGGGSMMGTMGAAAAGAGAGMLAGHVMGNMFGGGNDNDNFGGGGDIAAETGDFGGGGFDDGGGGGDLFAES